MSVTILLVHGDSRASQTEASALRAAGHTVSVVPAARYAFWHLEQGAPHLVLLHLRSSDPEGLALARQLHETAVPFVLVVRSGAPHDLGALPAGALDYLVQPVDAGRLAAWVGEISQRWLLAGR